MPRNAKPRKAYRPRVSLYPTIEDAALVFKPVRVLFDQLRQGEVDSAKGCPIFKDWLGQWCEIVPALEGWADCWQRVSDGEGLGFNMAATRRVARYLAKDVPLTEEMVDEAWAEVLACQRATLRIERRKLGRYMKDEQIAIEFDRLGVRNAA